MAGNVFGKIFRLVSFGESHGPAVGGVIEGCPAGVEVSLADIRKELASRKPGTSSLCSARKEEDEVEILSGLFEGRTTGMPIGFLVRNCDQKSGDYEVLKDIYRPSHADYTWEMKYGERDYRGGGRSSAREHVARVVAGALARQVLAREGITVQAYTTRIGEIVLSAPYDGLDLAAANPVRCPDAGTAALMAGLIDRVRREGDSVGGVVACVVRGLPAGLGEPVFDRFQARLAHAMMSINAARGFEYGSGFASASMRGSAHNDPFVVKDGRIHTETNRSGGIQGGVTNGEDVFFRVAFKPVSSIGLLQHTVGRDGRMKEIRIEGRHDPCVVPRAVPVVEAMTAMVCLDLLLEDRCSRLRFRDRGTASCP